MKTISAYETDCVCIRKCKKHIDEPENELKMLRALATTGIVTHTYIHEFKTFSHRLGDMGFTFEGGALGFILFRAKNSDRNFG